jgi:HAMP domain-containing protein
MIESVKKALLSGGARVLQSPTVLKLLQNERVMKVLMQALMTRGKIEGVVDGQLEKLARRLQLATQDEVRELKRALRRLEQEVERRGETDHMPRPGNGAAEHR